MSYCRWSDGDLYAYCATDEYCIHVAARCVTDEVKDYYTEATAATLLGRILWLGSKGCDYPWDALRYLKEDIIEEIEASEMAHSETTEPRQQI